MSFKFSKRRLNNLMGVHEDLIRVCELALKYSKYDFIITVGVRTIERQSELFKTGKSRTMNSRHLTGHAIDIAVLEKPGFVTWDFSYYEIVAEAFMRASKELSVPIAWGGDWPRFRDGPHFELDRKRYS